MNNDDLNKVLGSALLALKTVTEAELEVKSSGQYVIRMNSEQYFGITNNMVNFLFCLKNIPDLANALEIKILESQLIAAKSKLPWGFQTK
jgi:hypothetical protein